LTEYGAPAGITAAAAGGTWSVTNCSPPASPAIPCQGKEEAPISTLERFLSGPTETRCLFLRSIVSCAEPTPPAGPIPSDPDGSCRHPARDLPRITFAPTSRLAGRGAAKSTPPPTFAFLDKDSDQRHLLDTSSIPFPLTPWRQGSFSQVFPITLPGSTPSTIPSPTKLSRQSSFPRSLPPLGTHLATQYPSQNNSYSSPLMTQNRSATSTPNTSHPHMLPIAFQPLSVLVLSIRSSAPPQLTLNLNPLRGRAARLREIFLAFSVVFARCPLRNSSYNG
jgi:hypothetical protein